VYKKLRLIEEV